MKTSSYHRSKILSFFDLSKTEQDTCIMESNDAQHAEERSYVRFDNDLLPLDNFIRLDNRKVWHGVYGMTAFSAYFIRLNKSNDEALVAYRYC